MSLIETKYEELRLRGFAPVPLPGGIELPVVDVPTGDGQGTFFAYAFDAGPARRRSSSTTTPARARRRCTGPF